MCVVRGTSSINEGSQSLHVMIQDFLCSLPFGHPDPVRIVCCLSISTYKRMLVIAAIAARHVQGSWPELNVGKECSFRRSEDGNMVDFTAKWIAKKSRSMFDSILIETWRNVQTRNVAS